MSVRSVPGRNTQTERENQDFSYLEKGFEIIHAEDGSKHYYCRLCLDKKEDPTYKPLVLRPGTDRTDTSEKRVKSDQFGG